MPTPSNQSLMNGEVNEVNRPCGMAWKPQILSKYSSNMTHLETIRAACIKANPIVDKRKPKVCVLSKAAIEAGIHPKINREDGFVVGESRDKRCWRVKWYKKDGVTLASRAEVYSKDFIQIIDDENNEAEISLADVLMAMEAKYEENEFANESGWDWHIAKIVRNWNLRFDDLSKQTPETLAFIASLL